MGTQNHFSCFVIGEGTLLVQCGERLLQAGHTIHGVVAANPAITRWAGEKGIPHVPPGDGLLAFLKRQPCDYLFSIGNLRMLPAEVLTLPRELAINFHDALLPRYAGLHATSWALLGREKIHGVTWHVMTAKADEGQLLKQRAVDIVAGETAFSLNTKCYEAGIESFGELIAELAARTLQPRAQDLSARTYFGKYERPPNGCVLDWHRSAAELVALVRALDFGPYPNPLGAPKLSVGGQFVIVPEIELLQARSGAAPGTILSADSTSFKVATADCDVVFRKVLTVDAGPLSVPDFCRTFDVREDSRLASLDAARAEKLTALNSTAARHEGFWIERLENLRPVTLPYMAGSEDRAQAGTRRRLDVPLPDELAAFVGRQFKGRRPGDVVAAAFTAFLARVNGEYHFDVGYRSTELVREFGGWENFFAPAVPLRVPLNEAQDFTEAVVAVQRQLDEARRHQTYPRDLAFRIPSLRTAVEAGWRWTLPIAIEQIEAGSDRAPTAIAEVVALVADDAGAFRLDYAASALSDENAAKLRDQFLVFLRGALEAPERRVAELPLLSEAETRQLVHEWNATQTAVVADAHKAQLFEAQAQRTPDAPAVVFEDRQLTYQELNARANQLASHLRRLGVGPEVLVGIYLERSLEMMTGLLGILKAGGAYVPLDPAFPAERIAFMLEDTRAPVVLTSERMRGSLPPTKTRVVCLDADWPAIAREPAENVESGVTPDNLAYVLYTSGSTGKPKGVMVTHRNFANFIKGMDQRLGTEPGTWLAVTSISFDISTLELFWTLARGFKVVIHSEKDKALTSAPASAGPRRPHAHQRMDFSLFYFASDEGNDPANKYRLLLDGAKFADEHGFDAVWTPERHFHAFGGLYPNPSVASAAIASITKRVKIRAGSVVLPLHNPIRVAEEWSLVDNLSRGRVAISFAAGWQANDFVLAPQNYADRKNLMFREIETVRRLWRGESVTFPNGEGKPVSVSILPRPIQRELPVWVTAAANPETFRAAGEHGYNVLTHLLGQKFSELADKIKIYRDAWRQAGHPGAGHVTLMLHTFVGANKDAVREKVRKPFSNYLRTSVELIKSAPYAFPTFKVPSASVAQKVEQGLKNFTDEEMEGLLAFSFERYFETSGLFGTVEDCLDIVDHAKGIGVDEIGCLVDYGVDYESVMESLKLLNVVREQSQPAASVAERDFSFAAMMRRHQVTHLQCTPSLARILTLDPASYESLRSLKKLMLGGEALPPSLLATLRQVVRGEIHNMYGPTETTVWSTTYPLGEAGAPVLIGKPIANTEVYVLDQKLQLVPVGVPGELFIGGAGVARGYLNRPDLTAEKFVRNPFRAEPQARLYRTGDLCRWRSCGNLEILGRLDHQVKISGYRIELGEIETALAQHPEVREAVVVAREDAPGDKRLVGYWLARDSKPASAKELREFLQGKLPDYMVPAAFMTLDQWPLTPNGKIDRKALPAPERAREQAPKHYAAPQNDVERIIAEVWQEALNVEKVGVEDNFFDLGAHSLMMVQVNSKLRELLNPNLSIIEMFRFPTVQSLAAHLSQTAGAAPAAAPGGQDRAAARREAMQRRRQGRGAASPLEKSAV